MSRRFQASMAILALVALTLPAAACAETRQVAPLSETLFVGIQEAAGQPPSSAATMQAPTDGAPGLPPQDLAAGECGAFFWGRAMPNPLLVFENESRGEARLLLNDREVRESTPVRHSSYQAGQPINRRYGAVTVTGEVTALRGNEAIVGRALLRVGDASGQETVTPLIGLISCRE
jgi:hypothetical protein